MVAAVGIVLVLLSWWCCWSDALLKWKTICCCGNSSKNCSNRNEICAYYAYQFNEKKLNSEGKCITFFFSHETQNNKKNGSIFFFFEQIFEPSQEYCVFLVIFFSLSCKCVHFDCLFFCVCRVFLKKKGKYSSVQWVRLAIKDALQPRWREKRNLFKRLNFQ